MVTTRRTKSTRDAVGRTAKWRLNWGDGYWYGQFGWWHGQRRRFAIRLPDAGGAAETRAGGGRSTRTGRQSGLNEPSRRPVGRPVSVVWQCLSAALAVDWSNPLPSEE